MKQVRRFSVGITDLLRFKHKVWNRTAILAFASCVLKAMKMLHRIFPIDKEIC